MTGGYMKITSKWLEDRGACLDGKNWFKAQEENNGVKIIEKLINENQSDWANWLVVRLMPTHKMKIQYAVFAAEQVIDIFEKKYPDDKRPRQAIEAAKAYIEDPSGENRNAAAYAAHAADAAHAAEGELKTKIIKYGIKLLKDNI